MAIALEREKKINVMGIMVTFSLIVHLFVFTHISEIYKLKPDFKKKDEPIKIEVILQEIPKPAPIKIPPHSAPVINKPVEPVKPQPVKIPPPIPEPIKEVKIEEKPKILPVKERKKAEPARKKVVVEKRKKPVEKIEKLKEMPAIVNKSVEKPITTQTKVVVPALNALPVQAVKSTLSPSPVKALPTVKTPPASAQTNPHPLSSKSDEISAKAYFNTMRLMIEKNKRYPQMARRRNQEGSVRIRFLIDNNGNVNALEIVKKAEYESLNKAALEAVRRAAPFAKPPASVAKSALKLELTINFKLI